MKANEIGRAGEDYLCRYMERLGYKIKERNFRAGYGEIDIIAEKDGIIVFTEVKTRKSDMYGTPAESITYKKIRKIKETALTYLGTDDVSMRFDAAEVYYELRRGVFLINGINYIENAF